MLSTKILVHLYLQKNEGQSKVRNPSNRKTQILVIIFYLPTNFVHYYFSFANEFCMFKHQSNITLFVLVSLAQLVGQCIIYARSGVRTPVTTKKNIKVI